MSALLPAAVYGLEIPAGDVMIPADPQFPASFRITMAAIDPSAEPEFSGSAIDGTTPRATLKLVRQPLGPEDDDEDDSEYDEDEEAQLRKLLNGAASDEEDSSSDDEEVNGGPSDPSKTKKAREEAAVEALKNAIQNMDSDEEMSIDDKGIKLNKGKGVATGDEDDSSDDDSEEVEVEEFVLCTLDPAQHYQQPLDITVGEDERVFFKVSGTHSVFLTGNYVLPVDDSPSRMYDDDDEEDEDYDLSPDEDELEGLEDDDESDILDGLDDPRVTEVGSEDEAPKLVQAKGKNKRPADESEEEPAGLDEIMAKSLKPAEAATNGEVKLSKKQKKKLKNNAGQAVAAAETKDVKNEANSSESPAGKKVQFAKNLEQGPTGAKVEVKVEVKNDKKAEKKNAEKPRAALGVKVVQGVTIDDKKLGSGPAAKKGNKVSMRYIGKLKDGKVFDANKKGKPFSFKLGAGEVIKGWDIGVEGITIGGERRITIPASLGYGSKGMPGIPANSQLVFDIKCLEIN